MLSFRSFLILAASIGFCFCQEEFRCKPKPGCQIAQCDPFSARWTNLDFDVTEQLEKKEFPITCIGKKKMSNDANQEEVNNLKQEMVKSNAQHFSEVEDIKAEMEELRKSALISRNGMSDIRQSNRIQDQKILILESENKDLESELRDVLQSNKIRYQKILRLESENTDLKKEMSDVRQSNKIQDQKNSRLESENTDLKKSIAKMDSTISSLQTSVQSLQSENAEMKKDIQTLSKTRENPNIAEIKSTTSPLQTSAQRLQSKNTRREKTQTSTKPKENSKCEDGDIYYGGYCFWFDVTRRNFAASESKCKSRHSTAGHIINSFHYDVMIKILRAQIPSGSSYLGFWLGLRQDPSSGSVIIISNGLEASFLRWSSGNPGLRSSETNIQPDNPSRWSSETNVRLRVVKDASSVDNGMVDCPPRECKSGVICQYKSL